MRYLAICFALCIPSMGAAAEWLDCDDVRVRVSRAALPAITFDPNLSLAANNLRLAERDAQSHLLVAVDVSRREVNVQELVGRPIQFVCGGRTYRGQVTAFGFAGDGSSAATMAVFARVNNEQVDGSWLLHDGSEGKLRIARN